MKRKRAALYDPYLDTLGGGERYVLAIMKELEQAGYEIDIIWNQDLSKEIKDRLRFDFSPSNFVPMPAKSGIFGQKRFAEYDILLYITDGSYIFSGAKKTYVYCMVPKKELYDINLLDKIKTRSTHFITHSLFTQTYLRLWGIEAQLLYPYIDKSFFEENRDRDREKVILSVGRFFAHLHSKRHDVAIEAFRRLKKEYADFAEYKLVLAGGVKKEDEKYFDKIKSLVGDDASVSFKPNIGFDELIAIYKKAHYYWHFAGWGKDDTKNPEAVEHLGITPLEAMAAGCIPFVYRGGGVRELVEEGVSGFTFSKQEELIEKMHALKMDAIMEKRVREEGGRFVASVFGREAFHKNIERIFL